MSTLLPKLVLAYGFTSGCWRSFKLMRRIQTLRTTLQASGYTTEQIQEQLTRFHHDSVKPMLMYWSVFAVVNVYDMYFEFLVYWLPFYIFAKTCLVVWLSIPQFKGAVVVFEQVVQPMFSKFRVLYEDRFKPSFRLAMMARAKSFQALAMDTSLQAVSATELQHLHLGLEDLLIHLKRERDRRLEVAAALTSMPPPHEKRMSADFRRRLVDGEDLDDYESEDEDWSRLQYERTDSGKFKLKSDDD